MAINRRDFLKLSYKTAIIISGSNVLQSFAAKDYRLPDLNKVRARFAIASDGHYGQPNTSYESMHDQMIGWINAEQNKRGIDFTMINGDLFHDDTAMLPIVKAKWDNLGMPYYVSHGNHDKIAETGWQQTWNMPWHYAIEKNDVAFLVLNTADETGKYICPDLEFTKTQLEKYKSKNQLFVFMHITPFNWTPGGISCPQVVEMFDQQSNLKAVFHGHDHDQDNVKENNGKHYFFDSHVAGNWGTAYRGYRIVELLKNGDILTYQMNPAIQKQVNSNIID